MKAQWKRITTMLADFKPEDRVTVPVGPLLWANEEIERLRASEAKLLNALQLAIHSHGVMLLSDPPQEAWKFNRVDFLAKEAIDNAAKEQS